MNKEFVTYEQALALKELGFDERCFSRYYESGKLADSLSYLHHNYFGQVNAPLKQQAFRWFREKYKLYCYPNPTGSWRYTGTYRGEDKKGKHWVGSLRDISGIILFFNSFVYSGIYVHCNS